MQNVASQDFKRHLHRQLRFLERSCEAYDAGYTDESLRIATSIRVLVHDTRNSTSLLKHLGATNIQLSSTVEGAPIPGSVMLSAMGRLTLTTAGAIWKAAITADSIKTQLPVSDWWTQIVYIFGALQLSREKLVLHAANKDGGAHVDKTLTPEYEVLMTSGERGFFHYSPSGKPGSFKPIMDAHLVYLRQMAHELLSSTQLLALTA
jgi:hypothetical protein